ncbi:peptidoglycan-binding protein [Streptomyces sp. NPDC060028]|uniref:peptidoglycan-binding domain-containing protein n=1 Tax=Streptomyces sp. NPDC060028 TaxID=3347041 RepID=UPI0036A98F4B
MPDVKVVWTGLECRIRQEGEDEIFGTVQLITGMTPQPPVKFPDSGKLLFGPPGERIFTAQRLLYSGPAQDISVSAALVEWDSGDVEQQKEVVAQAVSAAATAAIAALTGGAGGVAKPLIDLLAGALVDFVADEVLGIGNDVYNPSAIFLSKDRLLDANARRQTLQRPDDPRTLQFTDAVIISGTDDAGDPGVYALYLDVQPSATPGGGGTPGMDDGVGTPTLSRGSQGAAVEKLQRLLNAHVPDFQPLAVDGDFGSVTDERVREYQRRVEIEVDGVVGPQTWGMLTGGERAQEDAAGTPTLSNGSHGPAVRKLQRLVNAHVPDLRVLAVDGVFGPVTERHVREFQGRLHIAVDGVVGPQTWGALTH